MQTFVFLTFLQMHFYASIVSSESMVIPSNQCDNGWHQFGNKCFIYHHDQAGANFHNALSLCEYVYHATLVTIHSEDEFNFISNMAFNLHHAKYSIWIGLIRVSNASFVWFDRSELNYTNWGPNEPNNWQSKNYCAVMSSAAAAKGKWFDVGCTTTYLVMCQKYLQKSTIDDINNNNNRPSNDTDSDMSIADEINMQSDDLFKSEENVDSNSDSDRHELQRVRILGNVNIVLTTIIFIIIFVFILSNSTFFSFRFNRRYNQFTSVHNTIDRRDSITI